jgi:hypothetical protein
MCDSKHTPSLILSSLTSSLFSIDRKAIISVSIHCEYLSLFLYVSPVLVVTKEKASTHFFFN